LLNGAQKKQKTDYYYRLITADMISKINEKLEMSEEFQNIWYFSCCHAILFTSGTNVL
jgi:hypothetical protein